MCKILIFLISALISIKIIKTVEQFKYSDEGKKDMAVLNKKLYDILKNK